MDWQTYFISGEDYMPPEMYSTLVQFEVQFVEAEAVPASQMEEKTLVLLEATNDWIWDSLWVNTLCLKSPAGMCSAVCK